MVDMYADEKKAESSTYANKPYKSKYFGTGEQVKEITSMSQIR